MSGYGPFGFSQTLAYFTHTMAEKDKDKDKDKAAGRTLHYVLYVLLRLALGVDISLVSVDRLSTTCKGES